MPRFQLSKGISEGRISPEPDMKVRVIVHESGRQSVIRSDIAQIEVRNADGTVDKHATYHDIGGVKMKEFIKMAEKPAEIDLKKLKLEGRISSERRLLPK